MVCQMCGCEYVGVEYRGKIRNGGLGQYTENDVEMYKCKSCGVIWHEPVIEDTKRYYASEEYRNAMLESTDINRFYQLHDKENMDKFTYTGTTIFRNKTVADIGCGGGAFLDFLSGVAKEVIAIEPTEQYHAHMWEKGYHVYSYAENAMEHWKEKIDVIVSFDVIEHVENPYLFLRDVYDLLKADGCAIIGTPTDAPVMRALLGEIYEKQQLFSTQHPWILNEKVLRMLAEKIGFKQISVKYYQRYGINNLFGWLREKKPRSEISLNSITATFDAVWRAECNKQEVSDYICLYVTK